MKPHTTFVAPALSLALTPAEKSASVCRLVLTPSEVASVARQLDLTPGRVRQWRRAGEGSPTLAQLFAAPAFGAALLAEQARRARDLEREGKAIADACERELANRRAAADKEAR